MSTETVSPATQATTTSSAGSDGPTLNAAFAGVRRVPPPVNDPNRTYAPGSPERAELKARLKSMADEKIDIPIIIGGRKIRTGKLQKTVMPHDHGHVLAEYHVAGPEHVEQAIAAAASGRAAGDIVARHAERGDDARPVEDCLSGGDRRCLRDDRLLAVQHLLRS